MFGMKARVFRFANVVGPKQTHGVGYDFVKRLKKNQCELRILGDGSQSKSYVYVDDILDAIFLVYEELNQKNSKFFDTYNVATDDYITVTEIANIALEVFNLLQNQVSFNYSGGDRGWKGDVPKVLLDVNKIKKLGWKANKNSHQAIRCAISSMKKELDNLYAK
jgi:UDP-glucose 4-epimerase